MSIKGNVKGEVKGNVKGEELESDLMFQDEEQKESFNRAELMKKPVKELAKIALPFTTLKLNTLERKSKPHLCDIIIHKSDKKSKEDTSTKARSSKTQSETEHFLNVGISFLEALKMSRDNEPLNNMTKEGFKSQAMGFIDKKSQDEEINLDKANNVLFAVTTTALLIDSVIGFKNVPALFMKVKNKFSKKDANASK